MKKLLLAAVEDDKYYQSFLQDLLKQLSISCSAVFFSSAEDFIHSSDHFDLTILDIDLPDTDGISLSKKISGRTEAIVFLTACSERMQEAFGMNVAGYLTKDMTSNQIIQTLDEVCLKLDVAFIKLHTSTGFTEFRIDHIYRITIEARKMFLYTKDQKIQIMNETLSGIELKFPDAFISGGKICLINPDHVYSVSNGDEILMDNGTKEYISRSRKIQFKTALMNRICRS